MRIIRAEEMGMCFGVRDALKIANGIDDPSSVTVYGELVHNPEVNRRLSDAGFHQSGETCRDVDVPTPLVLITAHGISNTERSKLKSNQKQLIDTTCPLVRRVHEAALELQSEGRLVVVIGKSGHVEVEGIVGDLNQYKVVAEANAVRCYASERIGVVSQTTMPPDKVAKIRARIEDENPSSDIRFIDTVCRPTKLRQQAMQDLLQRVDAVVVVGGKNSNNTKRLVQLCHEHDVPAYHVEGADEVREEWFVGVESVGLTAGTSTLDETIDEVHAAMERMTQRSDRQRPSWTEKENLAPFSPGFAGEKGRG